MYTTAYFSLSHGYAYFLEHLMIFRKIVMIIYSLDQKALINEIIIFSQYKYMRQLYHPDLIQSV